MDKAFRDGRVVASTIVWGTELERVADRTARRLTPGLNYRDLLLASCLHRRGGHALPHELIGPVYTTAPGVSGSLRRLEQAGIVTRGVGTDLRTRPVTLTAAAGELRSATDDEWIAFADDRLERLEPPERAALYRLLVKAAGLWDDDWPPGDD